MKKKLLSLLVLLMAAVSGAWADELQTQYTSDAQLNAVTVSTDMEITIIGDAVVTINGGLVIEDNATLTVIGPGKLVVNGTNGSQGSQGTMLTGNPGGQGTDGGAAITGNIVVKGATVQATGGYGGQGGYGGAGTAGSNPGQGGTGGKGGKGGAAFTGAVTIYSGTITAKGGSGGDGGSGGEGGTDPMNLQNRGPEGDKGPGGDGGNAFAGTLTFYGGTVKAESGRIGYGKPDGNTSKAFANDVTMNATTYELRGSNTGNNSAIDFADILNYRFVDIIAADYVEPTFDYVFDVVPSKHGSGTVKFFIGDSNEEVKGAMQADEGETVTMTITPDEGWVVDEANVTAAMLYNNWENAGARRATDGEPANNVPIQANIALTYVNNDNGVWTFTFTQPASSVRVSPKFLKSSTLYFDPADKTELMEVKVDGKGANPIQNGKITPILENTPVNLKANPGYKFRKVEVKKRPTSLTITDGGQFSTTLNIAGCTTWDEVITKNAGMIVKNEGYIYYKTGGYKLKKGDGDSEASVQVDDPFDPNATDYWWAELI